MYFLEKHTHWLTHKQSPVSIQKGKYMFTNNTVVTQHNQNQSKQRFGQTPANSYQQPNFTVYSAIYNDPAHLHIFGDSKTITKPNELKNTNSILILHGGEDISPSLYGHKPNKYTRSSKNPSSRDKTEFELACEAIKLGIPIFGICRGAQLACAIAGGSLIQHVNNHVSNGHNIHTTDGKILKTSSCHHQMMNPWEIEHELIAWAAPKLSDKYVVEYEELIDVPIEPEIVFFPKIKALAIQGHPEWMPHSSELVQYCFSLVKEKLL